MNLARLVKKWIAYSWVSFLLIAACTVTKDPLPDQVCLLNKAIDHRQNGKNFVEVYSQQTSFDRGKLVSFTEKDTLQGRSFLFNYQGGVISYVQSADGNTLLTLEYDSDTKIKRAIFTVNGKEQTTFVLSYDQRNPSLMTRLVETHTALPTNSFLASRTFQFTYNPTTRDVVAQSVVSGMKNGSSSEELVTYELDVNGHSPYYDWDHRIVLTLVALTQPTQNHPFRFLQRYALKTLKRFSVAANGIQTLQELSRFETEFDSFYNPSRRLLEVSTYQVGRSQPIVKKYVQTYSYDCSE